MVDRSLFLVIGVLKSRAKSDSSDARYKRRQGVRVSRDVWATGFGRLSKSLLSLSTSSSSAMPPFLEFNTFHGPASFQIQTSWRIPSRWRRSRRSRRRNSPRLHGSTTGQERIKRRRWKETIGSMTRELSDCVCDN